MTNYGKNKINMYYGILVKWNYDKGFIRKQMKKYLTKEEYKYFMRRVIK